MNMRRLMRIGGDLTGFMVLNLAAAFCFKECGTDTRHSWLYFTIGNTVGPLSLIFLMRVYAVMNANLAAALVLGLSAISIQLAFGMVYRARLAPMQWGGIALAIAGGILAVAGRASGRPAGTSVPESAGREPG